MIIQADEKIGANKNALQIIFKRPFFCKEIEGELIYATELPNKSKGGQVLGDLHQFLFHNYDALREIGSLGYSFMDDDRVHRYWGISEKALENTDHILDALSANKNAPKLPEYKRDMYEEMEDFFHGPRSLTSFKQEEITAPLFAKYLLNLIHANFFRKGWSYRQDDFIFTSESTKQGKCVFNDKRLDINILSKTIQLYNKFEKIAGLEPYLTIIKFPSSLFNKKITSNGISTSTDFVINPNYKENHIAAGEYGFGYHIKGFDELDILVGNVEKKLVQRNTNIEDFTSNQFSETNYKRFEKEKSNIWAAEGFGLINFENLNLPLPLGTFIDFNPHDIILDEPKSKITGLKDAINFVRNAAIEHLPE